MFKFEISQNVSIIYAQIIVNYSFDHIYMQNRGIYWNMYVIMAYINCTLQFTFDLCKPQFTNLKTIPYSSDKLCFTILNICYLCLVCIQKTQIHALTIINSYRYTTQTFAIITIAMVRKLQFRFDYRGVIFLINCN